MNIWLALNPDDPSEYILNTKVTDIRNPEAIMTKAFNSVFRNTFDSLTFVFDEKFDLKTVIDAIEEIDGEDMISVDYPGDISSCTVSLKGLEADIVVTSDEFRISLPSCTEPKRLIESFRRAQRLLVSTHEIKMLPLQS